MPTVICKQCGKTFYAKPFWINKGFGIYCSSVCQYQGARRGKIINCDQCGKEAYKQLKALTKSKSGKFFCGKSCQTKWRNAEFIQERHANWKEGRYAYRSVLSRNKVPAVCALCKINDRRVLAVHHIDEDRSNNNIDNLAWLCHNCHHLAHHHTEARATFMATIV